MPSKQKPTRNEWVFVLGGGAKRLVPILFVFSFGDNARNDQLTVLVDMRGFDFDSFTVVDEKSFRPTVKSTNFEE